LAGGLNLWKEQSTDKPQESDGFSQAKRQGGGGSLLIRAGSRRLAEGNPGDGPREQGAAWALAVRSRQKRLILPSLTIRIRGCQEMIPEAGVKKVLAHGSLDSKTRDGSLNVC
jgi:hypothetical protein